MEAARKEISYADDIMSAKAFYALIGSLVAGILLWMAVLMLIV